MCLRPPVAEIRDPGTPNDVAPNDWHNFVRSRGRPPLLHIGGSDDRPEVRLIYRGRSPNPSHFYTLRTGHRIYDYRGGSQTGPVERHTATLQGQRTADTVRVAISEALDACSDILRSWERIPKLASEGGGRHAKTKVLKRRIAIPSIVGNGLARLVYLDIVRSFARGLRCKRTPDPAALAVVAAHYIMVAAGA